MVTSIDLKQLFSSPNLGPPGHLRSLINTLRQAAPQVSGDTLTVSWMDHHQLQLAASPLADSSTEIYWGRIRLVCGPAPDPFIIC